MTAPGRNAYWSGGVYRPASLVGDTSAEKTFTGPTQPANGSGVVVGPRDKWERTVFVPGPPPPPPPPPPTGGRGAATLGTTNYTYPASGTLFVATTGLDTNPGTITNPFRTVAKAASVCPVNGTIVVRAGIYHESFTVPQGANPIKSIQAYPFETVWLDGSVITTGWVINGLTWVHTGVPTQFSRANGGNGSLPANYNVGDAHAAKADQVFIDGVPLKQIADGATPGVGQFSVDYTADTITIGSSPTAKEVRVSDLRFACTASAPVSWYGIGFRRYSPDNSFSVSAVMYYDASGGNNSYNSTFENCIFEYSALASLNINEDDITVQNCTFQYNMYQGFGGTNCERIVIDSCIVENCNRGLFDHIDKGAAIKITSADTITMNNNRIANNNAANGLWIDSTCVRVKITNNSVVGNHFAGITYEEANGPDPNRCLIVGNYIDGCNYGVHNLASGDVKIWNNTITNSSVQHLLVQQDRNYNPTNYYMPASVCPWDVRNCQLANNVFGVGAGDNPVARVRVFSPPHTGTDGNIPARDADAIGEEFRNNCYPTGTSGVLVQWGIATASPYYTNYSAFTNGALGTHTTSTSGNYVGTPTDSLALAMPTDVATALGVTPGTKKQGAYLTA